MRSMLSSLVGAEDFLARCSLEVCTQYRRRLGVSGGRGRLHVMKDGVLRQRVLSPLPRIIRRFVYLLSCRKRRFEYRSKDGGGVGGATTALQPCGS